MPHSREHPCAAAPFLRRANLHGHLVAIEASRLRYHPEPCKLMRKVLVNQHALRSLPGAP